jgi:hypothetical protein
MTSIYTISWASYVSTHREVRNKTHTDNCSTFQNLLHEKVSQKYHLKHFVISAIS